MSINNRYRTYKPTMFLSRINNNLVNKLVDNLNIIFSNIIITIEIYRHNFKLLLFLFVFCIIEYVHILLGKQGIDGLTDIRMILYSPFYGSVIVFALYCIYLLISKNVVRYFHILFTVKLITSFSIFFIGYWFLLHYGFVDVIENTNFNNANGVSYYALFACVVLLLAKNDILRIKYRPLCFLINLSVILLNTTRGAYLVLLFVLAYTYISSKTRKLIFLFFSFIAVLLFLFDFNFIIESFFGKDFFLLLDYASNNSEEMSNIDDYNIRDFLNYYNLEGDSASISSVSRILANSFAVQNFVNNPLIGVGQTESYSLEIFGSSIHSFFFMLISSVGGIGLIVFVYLLKNIYLKNNNKKYILISYLFPFCVLLFTNTIPVYFALLPFVTVVMHSNKILQGRRYV